METRKEYIKPELLVEELKANLCILTGSDGKDEAEMGGENPGGWD